MTDKLSNGESVKIFESGAMLEYIVDRYDKDHNISYPRDTVEHWQVTSWLHWQMGGLGPMQGQANHFKRYAPEKIQYATERYIKETRRLYKTLHVDTTLAKSSSGFIVGDRVTIADIASWGWVATHASIGITLDEFPHLKVWLYKLLKRKACEKGRHVPTPHTAFQSTEEDWEKLANANKDWIQEGMRDDAQKQGVV